MTYSRALTPLLRAITLILISILFWMVGCSKPSEPTSGTSSETQNTALVQGRLFLADGTPAKHALVRFIFTGFDPHSSQALRYDTAITDSTGWYGTNTLVHGLYNIFGADSTGTLEWYQDSADFTPDTLRLPDATLLPPGYIRGIVQLSPPDNPNTVTIDVIGAIIYALPESDGSFAFSHMAAGHYRLRFRTTDDKYEVFDTVVTVASGVDKTLDNPVVLPLKIPIPTGFSLSYDTLSQVVSLRWNKADTAKVKGYYVYRRRMNSALQCLTPLPIPDTVYFDSSAMQDETFAYKVASVNFEDIAGVYTRPDTVTIRSVFTLIRSFGDSGSGAGEFLQIRDIKCLKNGNLLALDQTLNRVTTFDSLGQFLFSFGNSGTDVGQFNVPASAAEDDSGNIYVQEWGRIGRIQEFFPNGVYRRLWAWPGTQSFWSAIACFRGELYIAASDTPEIKAISTVTGQYRVIGVPGSSATRIAVDSSSRLFISNSVGDNIIAAGATGAVLATWGGRGHANGQFRGPSSICCGRGGRIFISDQANARIQVFSVSGGFITKLVLAEIPAGAQDAPEEGRPTGISLDAFGNLFVAKEHRIYQYRVNLP